jgi:hypothetical protein
MSKFVFCTLHSGHISSWIGISLLHDLHCLVKMNFDNVLQRPHDPGILDLPYDL